MIKNVVCIGVSALLFCLCEASGNLTKDSGKNIKIKDSSNIAGFLNAKIGHERSGTYAFGKSNTTAVALTPVVAIGNLTLECDFWHGNANSYSSAMKTPLNTSKLTSYNQQANLIGDMATLRQAIENNVGSSIDKKTGKKYSALSYARAWYADKQNNLNYVVGNVSTKTNIGFQQGLSGLGISVFRTNNTSGRLTSAGQLILTNKSKIECKLGDEKLGIFILAPGVYTIDDLPEEAKLPGVSIKISDDLDRSYEVKVDYFGQYSNLKKGESDIDFITVFENYWNIDNPLRTKYKDHAKLHAAYRYGYTDDITLTAGAQTYKSGVILSTGQVYNTKYGKFATDLGYSYDGNNDSNKSAFAFGVLYSISDNKFMYADIYTAIYTNGFSNLGKNYETSIINNAAIDRNFLQNNGESLEDFKKRKAKIWNTVSGSVIKRLTCRLYTKPIYGVVPAFIFNGYWSKDTRLREYTLSAMTKIYKCTLTLSAGLTYDDPSGGRNLKSPDRRALISCVIPLGDEVKIKGSYANYDNEQNKLFSSITYNPKSIDGLELNLERTVRPGVSNPKVSVKYDTKYGNLKAESSLSNNYENKEPKIKTKHTNQQKFYFGTRLSSKGLSSYKKTNINTMTSVK